MITSRFLEHLKFARVISIPVPSVKLDMGLSLASWLVQAGYAEHIITGRSGFLPGRLQQHAVYVFDDSHVQCLRPKDKHLSKRFLEFSVLLRRVGSYLIVTGSRSSLLDNAVHMRFVAHEFGFLVANYDWGERQLDIRMTSWNYFKGLFSARVPVVEHPDAIQQFSIADLLNGQSEGLVCS